jgi:hypothetical protein
MAYFYFTNKSLFKIAKDDVEKNNLTDVLNYNIPYIEKIVSDEDFNYVFTGNKTCYLNNSDEIVYENTSLYYEDLVTFNQYFNEYKKCILLFVKNNINNPNHSNWESYFNSLNNVSFTETDIFIEENGVKVRVSKTLPELLIEKGISYKSAFQIPG